MKKLSPIIGISLEGFQVFDKPTYIPLEKLTLMFGPNSAGKSAVQDALELCAELRNIDYSNVHMVQGKARELLLRHWRRSDGQTGALAERLSIGIRYTLEDDFYSLNGRTDHGEPTAYCEAPVTLESRWSFERVQKDGVPYFGSFEFFLGSELLVEDRLTLGEGGYGSRLSLNVAHPLLKKFSFRCNFAEISKSFSSEVALLDDQFTFLRGVSGFQWCGRGVEEKRGRWLVYYPPSDQKDAQKNYEPLQAVVAELGDVIGNILFLCNEYTDFLPEKVDASRTVPTQNELTFQLGMPPAHRLIGDLAQRYLPAGNPAFQKLAASLADLDVNSFFGGNLAAKVNSALSDHLFLEQGYQIDYEYRVLMSKANSRAVREIVKKLDDDEVEDDKRTSTVQLYLDSSEIGFLVALFLRDGKGRKHLFEDVGSGIGYILPVLCAIFDGGVGAKQCFIQQPELHLHPALQAALGDVFIEASNAGKQILIETHSEHLLLRILKRVRQTHLEANTAPELKINADEVCVLYFDPSPEGITTVRRLRVTEDGEFMDRWPRGFFAERDQELFDE